MCTLHATEMKIFLNINYVWPISCPTESIGDRTPPQTSICHCTGQYQLSPFNCAHALAGDQNHI